MKTDDQSVRVGVDDVAPWTLTASGKKVYYLTPTIEMISFADIATHTGNLCRFTGATKRFYSVAQHNCLVGQLAKKLLDEEGVDRNRDYWDQIIACIIHDAAEYITNDIASPLKAAMLGRYKWIETGILRVIFDKAKVEWGYHNEFMKTCDNIALQIERYYLMPDHPDWPKVSKSEMVYGQPEFQDPITAAKNWLNTLRYAMMQRNAL